MNPTAETRARAAAPPLPQEAELIARARNGDRAAVERLVSRYADDVFEAAFRVLGDHDRAQDAAQDALVNAVRGLSRFRSEASFRTWVLRIAVNTARSAARSRGRRREIPMDAVPEPAGDGRDPARRAVDRVEADRAGAALERLPEKQRLAVSLRLHQGLSYREIAEATGSTEGSARVNYHLGIKRLREWLA